MIEQHHVVHPQAANPAMLDVLLIRCWREWYSLPVQSIREVARYRSYTPVPGMPPVLPGIINQRGTIMPVVDLRLLLGFNTEQLTSTARLVIVQHNAIDMALIVEEVLDIAALTEQHMQPVPGARDAKQAALCRGVVQHGQLIIAVLDLDAVLARLRDDA